MNSRQGSSSGQGRHGSTLSLGLNLLFAALLSYLPASLLSACTALPEPVRSEPPVVTVPHEPLAELPWINVHPARWYGNSQAACSITFDDGTLDQYLLSAPELEARGIRGTFFIITGPRAEGVWTDGKLERRLFSWDQVRDLHARGHEIASHTATHVDLKAHPQQAEAEIGMAHESLSRELSLPSHFSLGWPYWRSSPAANDQARRFHYAARAGGIQGISGLPGLGGSNGTVPDDYMRIGSRAILSTDTLAKLAPLFEEVHGNGGWFVPSFHGINDGLIQPMALGWEALNLETFRHLIDGLASYGFWFAPFGEVARYAIQRDMLELQIWQSEKGLRIHYSGKLDPAVFNHRLTLVIELPLAYRLKAIFDAETGKPLPFQPSRTASAVRYLVDLPPGDGTLHILACRDSLNL
jgi:peptidoglycan/xylan/chitin deacetylase (PgdA/CDA1 family)